MTHRSQSATAEKQKMEEQRARIAALQKIGAKRANDQASGLFADDYDANEIMGDYDWRAARNQYRTEADACHTEAGNFSSEVGMCMFDSPARNATPDADMNSQKTGPDSASQAASKPATAGVTKRVTITIEIEGFPS